MTHKERPSKMDYCNLGTPFGNSSDNIRNSFAENMESMTSISVGKLVIERDLDLNSEKRNFPTEY